MPDEFFNFSAPINDQTSYGLVALNVISNTSCKTFPIGQISYNFANNLFSNDVIYNSCHFDEWNRDLPSVRLYHQFALAESIGRGKRVGWPIFELDRFSKKEICDLNSLDEIIVCSKWAKEVILDNGVNKKISIVPLGVNTECFKPIPEVIASRSNDDTYGFFSCGKYEVRKGQDQIVEAFNLAFSNNDKVELFLSMFNQFMTSEDLRKIKEGYSKTKLGDKIKFVGPWKSQQRLAEWMNVVDCGVFPSKAEGWGLETLEMMACGKPVIVSNYSGHTEYCNIDNSLLIDVNNKTSAYDGKWFFNQGNWGVIETSDIVELMRFAYSNRIKQNKYGIETAHHFSWTNTVNRLKDAIQ